MERLASRRRLHALVRSTVLLLSMWLCLPTSALAQGAPVVLTFNAQEEADAAAIRELALDVPATYFVAGQFADRHRQLVAELAQRHTVGSLAYSHVDLTTLDQDELRKELLATKLLLREITGEAPRWFRAPMLSYNAEVSEALHALGYRHDSSEFERWTQQHRLLELPISNSDGGARPPVSDHELFVRQGLSGETALQWLQARYDERADTGRPLVVLLSPRTMVQHRAVLQGFIDYVRAQDGEFVTAQQWLDQNQAITPQRMGVWINLALGQQQLEQVVADITAAGISDVYLMARDPVGNDYFAKQLDQVNGPQDRFGHYAGRLRQAGVQVHAWLPMLNNSVLAQLHPDWAMVGENGAVSLKWLSPAHPEVIRSLADTVDWLADHYDLDGIHLDYFRYPDLSHDFSPSMMAGAARALGLEQPSPQQLLKDYYSDWVDWRAGRITALLGKIQQTLHQGGHGDLTLSAALIADAALTYSSRDTFGQDYAQLAGGLDRVIPMAYF